jgi:hypothetical protein
MLCINSGVIGTEKHLLIDDGFFWSKNIPPGFWHLSSGIKKMDNMCLNSLLKLEGIDIDLNPPNRFVKPMNLILPNGGRPWSLIMPQDAHREFVERIKNEAICNLQKIDQTYFRDAWGIGNTTLKALLPAKVDPVRVEQILEDSGMNKRVVEGLIPDETGYARPIVYDRFGTRTGRLTVYSGPGILTMKKSYRDAFVSSYVGGHIVSLDFSALEVRVLLYEAGGRCDEADLYAQLAREIFMGEFDRKAVKAAVIAESYGSGKASLSQFLGISGEKLDSLVEGIRGFLGTKSLKESLLQTYWKTGFIRNRFGRKVAIEEPKAHIFVNSYAQSTGVDISLLGFNNIIKSLAAGTGVRPLFVLHDELILDVSPHRIKEVEEIKRVNIPGYTQDFPIRCSILK